MARETSGRIKKYGVCLNSGCTQYKQIQEIVHGEMECPECKKKLSPCAPPKKKKSKNLPMIIGGAVLLIAIIAGCILVFSGGDEPSEVLPAPADSTAAKAVQPAKDTVTTVKTDTVVVRDTIVKDNTTTISEKTSTKTIVNTTSKANSSAPKAAAASGSGTLRLSYGKYSGAIKNGYPHGQGRLTYSKSRVINRNDAKGRTADAGDYVIGEFYNGFVVYGKHYDSAGNLIGSLNFGVGSESSYDSK
jgi:hypothetical protein